MARDERAEPGELEDLGGAPALDAAARLDAPDEADRARLLSDAPVAVVRAGLVGGLYENSSGNRVDGVEEGKTPRPHVVRRRPVSGRGLARRQGRARSK